MTYINTYKNPINDPISIQQGYNEKCFSLPSDFLNMGLFKGKALSFIQQHLSYHRKVITINKQREEYKTMTGISAYLPSHN